MPLPLPVLQLELQPLALALGLGAPVLTTGVLLRLPWAVPLAQAVAQAEGEAVAAQGEAEAQAEKEGEAVAGKEREGAPELVELPLKGAVGVAAAVEDTVPEELRVKKAVVGTALLLLLAAIVNDTTGLALTGALPDPTGVLLGVLAFEVGSGEALPVRVALLEVLGQAEADPVLTPVLGTGVLLLHWQPVGV